MKEYCVDLEIAKELKKNGFPQDTYFYHEAARSINEEEYIKIIDKNYNKLGGAYFYYSAPTTAELLKGLPNFITIENYVCILSINRALGGMFYVLYRGNKKISNCFKDKKLSKALARLWIYLKKEGYIK